jgi:hypothetical protein
MDDGGSRKISSGPRTRVKSVITSVSVFYKSRFAIFESGTSHCNREYFEDPFLTSKFSILIILLSSFTSIFFFSVHDFVYLENQIRFE